MNKESLLYDDQEIPLLVMVILSIFVGIIAGFGAVFFRYMIGFVHNFVFFGQFNIHYNANMHTPASPLHWLIILVPVGGAVIVAWMVKTFAPEAKGHGVPEVMEAIYFKGGKIRPIVAVIKSIVSAISIGTGGSVGREGPIAQIGAAFGSILGGFLKMPARQRSVLVGAGAAAGIAATFNTPIGALAFGIELMLVSVSASTLLPLGITIVTATYIGRAFLGVTPSFYIPSLVVPGFHLMPMDVLTIFIPFGIVVGLVSVVFIRGLYWTEDVFDKMPGNYYTRHMTGMLFVGLLMYGMIVFKGHYYVQGVGYATIVDILSGMLNHPWFLLILVLAKLLLTCLTLGSGASGGIFSPSLFMGAALGAAFGMFIKMIFPGFDFNPALFAMAGMAGMIGGSTGAVMTAIIMIIEMTNDGSVILPIIVTATTAYAVRKSLLNESIYTMKLFRKGLIVPEGLQSAIALVQRACDVMSPDFEVVTMTEFSAHKKRYLEAHLQDKAIIITKHNKILGVLRHTTPEDGSVEEHTVIDHRFVLFPAKAKMPTILRSKKVHDARYVLVMDDFTTKGPKNIVGFITDREIMDSNHTVSYLLH